MPRNELQATVILPTTGDRAAVLPWSIQSVLRQTAADLELFIVGDGAADASREVIQDHERQDPRVRFFDHPKGQRRGEPYRHAALAEARGRIVVYLCDRDLMLPWHVETMIDLLRNADFGHTLRFFPTPDDRLIVPDAVDYRLAAHRGDALKGWRPANGIPLSLAGHTLAAYRRLPYGWRTTPSSDLTDFYMWQQFFADASCRTASRYRPTVLTFLTNDRRGWTADDRARELAKWQARLAAPDGYGQLLERLLETIEADRASRRPAGPGLTERVSNSPLARQVKQISLVAGPARWLWQRVVSRPS
jgi:glycosyltransferase involved in cell wall biosynthesis